MTDCAVLINTWDGYSEAWPMMEHGIRRHWVNCSWRVYWMCNHKKPPLGIPISTDSVTTWSFMMREALIKLMADGFDYFMFLHEDYWISNSVMNYCLVKLVNGMAKHDVDHIQLAPSWDVMVSGGEWREDWIGMSLHAVHEKSDYRTSNQASLWKTQSYYDILVELMREDKNTPWDFEVYGSELSEGMTCLCASPGLPFISWPIEYVYRHLPEWESEPIVKGKWTSAAIKYCEQEGIPYNFKEGDSVVK